MPVEIPGDSSTANQLFLDLGSFYGSEIEIDGDRDWYSVQLVAGRTYTAGLAYLPDGFLRLYAPGSTDPATGTVVATDDNSGLGNTPLLTYTATLTGTYFLKASNAGDAGTGGYNVAMGEVTGDTAAGNITSTATLGADDTVTAATDHPGDTDWYAVTVTAGEVITVRAKSGTTPPDQIFPEIVMHDATGAETRSVRAYYEFEAPADCTYYIEIGDIDGPFAGNYTVSKRPLGPVESIEAYMDKSGWQPVSKPMPRRRSGPLTKALRPSPP